MGAIRAYEMRLLGMNGFGKVYSFFARQEDFRDDEVALIHSEEEPYKSITEPLVHMRVALKDLEKMDILPNKQRIKIEKELSSMWFGERNLKLLQKMVVECSQNISEETIDLWIKDFNKYRIKTLDLKDYLCQRPWKKI